jgi:anti-anti-sigma regulatory factor
MSARLIVVEGRAAGSLVELRGPVFLIGCDPDCHHRPRDPAVAPRHCQLSVGEASLAIRDLGSSQGTYLNGLRIAADCSARVRPGDRIRVGETVYEVALGAGMRGEEAPTVTIAERFLRRRLGSGPSRPEHARRFVRTYELAGIPFHQVLVRRVVERAAVEIWRGLLCHLADRTEHRRVVLDLRLVVGLSPEAADILVAFYERVRRRGVELKLCEADPSILPVLERAGLLSRIPVCLDPQVAVWSRW